METENTGFKINVRKIFRLSLERAFTLFRYLIQYSVQYCKVAGTPYIQVKLPEPPTVSPVSELSIWAGSTVLLTAYS